jgi:hypothetical protein
MAVPRKGEINPEAFRLCTKCHLYTEITGITSNFRDDLTNYQFHEIHLNYTGENFISPYVCSDTDYDGVNCIFGTCADSAMTCIVCHNVHGAKGNKVMIRHGELISSPGTTNKVPALDFHWYKDDGVTETTVLEESLYGGLLCGLTPDVCYNHVCSGCHSTGEKKWWRTPGGPEGLFIEAVWASKGDLPTDEFCPGDAIRYNVRYHLSDTGTFFAKVNGTVQSTTGTAWQTTLDLKKSYVTEGTSKTLWNKNIPPPPTPSASYNSTAKITITVKILDGSGGTELYRRSAVKYFKIKTNAQCN